MLRGFPVALTGENDGHDDDDGDFDISPRKGVSQRYRHNRHHRHWDNRLLPGLPGCWVRFGCRPVTAAVPPFSYKDVINDILVFVIIGDKDAVYDILVSQKPEDHPGAPAARDSIFGDLGVVRFRQKDKRENTEGKDIPPFYISNISNEKQPWFIPACTFALLLILLYLTILRLSRPISQKS